MRITYPTIIVAALAVVAAGCATQTSASDTPADVVATTAPTTTSAPTTTPPPATTTTAAPETTTTTEAAMQSPISLEPYDGNPVIPTPTDTGGAMLPSVVVADGIVHMWFTQTADWMTEPTAIYHATSPDGLTWEVDEKPVLTADGDGFDAFSVGEGTVVETDDGWVMYYNAAAEPTIGPGPAIGRATAPGPDGPWTADPDPVLVTGDQGSWDSGFVTPATVIVTDEGIRLYYSGGANYPEFEPTATGLATAPDTTTFTKEPGPVIAGVKGWDGQFAWEAAVFPFDSGYGALYTGDPKTLTGEAIGYAWSADGTTWDTASDNPLLQPRAQAWASIDVVAGSVVEMPDGTMLLYYSGNVTGFDFAIGVAELTVES